MDKFERYRGMSAEMCSREALRLVQAAAQSGQTFALIAPLTALELCRRLAMGPAPSAPLPTWAEQNMDLRKARDAMNEQKRIEAFERKQAQQQEQQRQFWQHAWPVQKAQETACIGLPRDTRPKRCVAGL